ncbi:MAG: hypothetical protein Q8N51_09705 [Gammaproteobacteria bacterium]|nr:hypothetical protein [Gammaproteobacteria bacterium]
MTTQANTQNNTDTKDATPLQTLLAELAEAKRLEREAGEAYRDLNDADKAGSQEEKRIAQAHLALRVKGQQVRDSFAALVQVGDPVTRSGYSECHAGYVIQINEARTKLVMQDGNARLLNGANSGEPDALHFSPGGFCGHTSGTQRWEITPNPNGRLHIFTLRKNGRWIETGLAHNQGKPLCAGHHHHHDFNF